MIQARTKGEDSLNIEEIVFSEFLVVRNIIDAKLSV